MKQAEIIVKKCLLLKEDDRFLIVCDRANKKFGEAIKDCAKNICKDILYIELEDYVERPIKKYPDSLRELIDKFKPTASIYLATSLPGEVTFRIELIRHLVSELKVRHAHLPGLDEKIWNTGLLADYEKVEQVTLKVFEIVKDAKEVVVRNSKGTDIVVELGYRWVPDTGVFREQGKFGNLPAGEVFTCPKNIEGRFAAEILGDYFVKYGKLKDPVVLTIEKGRIVDIRCKNKELEKELCKYIFEGPENADRIGEFAIGTNIFLKEPIGNLLQDEKLPGVHIAAGDPIPEETGADWSCDVHLDFISLDTDVIVDGKKLMDKGTFVI